MNVYIDKALAHIRTSDRSIEWGAGEDIQIAAVNAAASVLCVIKAAMLGAGSNQATLNASRNEHMNGLYLQMVESHTTLNETSIHQLGNAVRMCSDWMDKGLYDPGFRVAPNVIMNVTNLMQKLCEELSSVELPPEFQMAMDTLTSMGCSDITPAFLKDHVPLGADPMRALPDVIIAWRNKPKHLPAGVDLLP